MRKLINRISYSKYVLVLSDPFVTCTPYRSKANFSHLCSVEPIKLINAYVLAWAFPVAFVVAFVGQGCVNTCECALLSQIRVKECLGRFYYHNYVKRLFARYFDRCIKQKC